MDPGRRLARWPFRMRRVPGPDAVLFEKQTAEFPEEFPSFGGYGLWRHDSESIVA